MIGLPSPHAVTEDPLVPSGYSQQLHKHSPICLLFEEKNNSKYIIGFKYQTYKEKKALDFKDEIFLIYLTEINPNLLL